MNTQPIEKQVSGVGDILDVHSIFYTIQGEGPFSGEPAVFIRLAGCNLQCPGCDTEYTSPRRDMGLWTVVAEVYKALQAKIAPSNMACKKRKWLVVITGGEPFRQPLGPLVRELLSRDFKVQVETNGTLYDPTCRRELEREWNFIIVCSPKTPKIHPEIWKVIDHFKYVLDADNVSEQDGLPNSSLGMGSERVARPHEYFGMFDSQKVWVSPMDSDDPEKNKRNMEAAVRSCMKYGYRLSLQTHKLLGVP